MKAERGSGIDCPHCYLDCDEIGIRVYECIHCGLIIENPGHRDERLMIVVEHGNIHHILDLGVWVLSHKGRWEEALEMESIVADLLNDTSRALRVIKDHVEVVSRNEYARCLESKGVTA